MEFFDHNVEKKTRPVPQTRFARNPSPPKLPRKQAPNDERKAK
jgi:hypothetical protein